MTKPVIIALCACLPLTTPAFAQTDAQVDHAARIETRSSTFPSPLVPFHEDEGFRAILLIDDCAMTHFSLAPPFVFDTSGAVITFIDLHTVNLVQTSGGDAFTLQNMLFPSGASMGVIDFLSTEPMPSVVVRDIPFDLAPRAIVARPHVEPEAAITAVYYNQTSPTKAEMTTLTTTLIDYQNTYCPPNR